MENEIGTILVIVTFEKVWQRDQRKEHVTFGIWPFLLLTLASLW